MSRRRVLGLAAGAVLLSGTAGLAQPLPVYQPPGAAAPFVETMVFTPTPVHDWSGFYLGANVGWGFGAVAGTEGGVTDSWSANGLNVGITAGMNWSQFSPLFLGLQLEVGWTFFAAGSSTALATATATSLTMYGSFRVRAGYLFNDWLVYATAGPAWQRVTASGVGITASPHTQVHPGFAFGAGVERPINDTMIARFEVLSGRFADLPYDGGNITLQPRRLDLRFSLLWQFDPK
ncbi:MAG: porin family protein [Bauldia sp.]|nr:porin family protein [Bauldia sp.]